MSSGDSSPATATSKKNSPANMSTSAKEFAVKNVKLLAVVFCYLVGLPLIALFCLATGVKFWMPGFIFYVYISALFFVITLGAFLFKGKDLRLFASFTISFLYLLASAVVPELKV